MVLECSCSSARARARVFSCSCPCSNTQVLVSARVLECSSVRRARLLVLKCSSCSCSSARVLKCTIAGNARVLSLMCWCHARVVLVLECSSARVFVSARVLEYSSCSSARAQVLVVLDCSCHMDVSGRHFSWSYAPVYIHIYTYIYIPERCLHFRFKRSICSCT